MALSKPLANFSSEPDSSNGNIVFRFKLPEGLALRSASIVDGIPELRFEASPKVPTLHEQDIATAFRLAMENKRPEFFYVGFPPTHPLHQSRWFKHYSPPWLRETKIGTLLADTDWNMKCLHVGARTNEEKTEFKSWPLSSNLSGLATLRDFQTDGDGSDLSIKMYCDYATVEKSEYGIYFPEEPKMKIVDQMRSQYSKYITKHLPSVAYHDEPNFLKMQELIKLIIVVEWLYEKGVRVNHQWVLMHTAKTTCVANDDFLSDLPESKAPPKDMIPPRPSVFEPPSSDATVRTRETEMYETLKTKQGVEWRYGYYDFGGAQVKMFKEDGTEYVSQKCVKISIEQDTLLGKSKAWLFFPLLEQLPTAEMPKEGVLQLLPKDTHQEITTPFPVSVDTTVERSSEGNQVRLKLTRSFHPHPPLALPHLEETMVIRATTDDLNFLLDNEDPNTPIRPEIPGVCEAIIPDVNSWEELFSELTAPMPRFWQDPFIGIGQPTASGGVCTQNIEVRHEEPRARKVETETGWKDGYKKMNNSLVIRPKAIRERAIIQLVSPLSTIFAEISRKFTAMWIKGNPCSIRSIFSISNSYLQQKWVDYKRRLGHLGHPHGSEQHFHGTMLACNIAATQALCGNCGICGITCAGMDPKCIRKHIDFQRFGPGFYLAPHSSKCNDYTLPNSEGHRAMLLCDVLPGRKHSLEAISQNLTGPPAGYDSVNGVVGSELNYPEIVVYNPDAVMPET